MTPADNQTDTMPKGLILAAVLLVGAMAAGLVWAQRSYPETHPEYSLSFLNQRADFLGSITNAIQRDQYCIPLSALGRQLDKALPPDARVFFSGMVGETNGPKLGYYYFLRNYLFPRDVEISLGTNLVYHEGWFQGTPCDSPAELRTNGFDLLIRYGDKGFEFIPLSQKVAPK